MLQVPPNLSRDFSGQIPLEQSSQFTLPDASDRTKSDQKPTRGVKKMKRILFGLTILIPSIIKAEGIDKKIDKAFQPISDFFSQLIFFEVFGIPFVLILLVFSAIFFRVLFLSGKYLYDLYYAETITHMPKSQIDSFFSGDIREFTLHGVGLLEPRSSRQSVGVGVGKGGVGIGTSKSFFSGEEQTKIDSGRIHFDNEKIQFIGATNQISWAWKKIVSVSIALIPSSKAPFACFCNVVGSIERLISIPLNNAD